VGWGGPGGPAGVARGRDPADSAARIRHLGELHQAGLVTDEEFSVKKAQLLAEL
ncbi:SHOCT domain-containing protein, partial [Streptomyces sp. NPDC054829]